MKARKVYISPMRGRPRMYAIRDAVTNALIQGWFPSWEEARDWVRVRGKRLPRASKGVRRNPNRATKKDACIPVKERAAQLRQEAREHRKEAAKLLRGNPRRISNQAAADRILKWGRSQFRGEYLSQARNTLEFHQALNMLKVHAAKGNKRAAKLLHQFEKSGGWKSVTDKALRANPSRREHVEAADNLLASFSGRRANKELRVSQPAIKTGLVIGKVTGVMYAADRGDGTHEYCHRFAPKSRPLLITNHDGQQLGIVGGRFRFTDRGIVDE